MQSTVVNRFQGAASSAMVAMPLSHCCGVKNDRANLQREKMLPSGPPNEMKIRYQNINQFANVRLKKAN